MHMQATDLQARLYQAFLRGYAGGPGPLLATGTGALDSFVPIPSPALLAGAALESRELRRSIDACQQALEQIAELPDAEKEQLRAELRATLDHLVNVSDQLLAQLKPAGDASAESGNTGSERPSDQPPGPSARGRKTPRRR